MGKAYVFNFNAANDFTAEVPTEIKYLTLSKKEEVFQTNYAQSLLDNVKVSHGENKGSHVFELVEQIEHPVVVEAKVKSRAVGVKKEKKNEIQTVSQ
jgi:hypothetical protein